MQVDLVRRVEDVQPLHLIDFGGCLKTRLKDAGCDVVAGADPGCEDEYPAPHNLMLGQPSRKARDQFPTRGAGSASKSSRKPPRRCTSGTAYRCQAIKASLWIKQRRKAPDSTWEEYWLS